MIGAMRYVTSLWSPETDRGAIARLLWLPVVGACLSLLAAFWALHLGLLDPATPPPTGLWRFSRVIIGFGVVWAGVCGPWYLAGICWYLWATRAKKIIAFFAPHDETPFLLRTLWKIPLASASLCWVPLLTRMPTPNGISRMAIGVGIITVQLVVGYLWIAIVRGITRLWRGV
jgi:hypothetical protein